MNARQRKKKARKNAVCTVVVPRKPAKPVFITSKEQLVEIFGDPDMPFPPITPEMARRIVLGPESYLYCVRVNQPWKTLFDWNENECSSTQESSEEAGAQTEVGMGKDQAES